MTQNVINDTRPSSVTNGGTGLSSTTANQLLYSSASNTISGLATANSGLLVTSGAGVPSISTVIPNGVTATTQSASDNSTKVATTAYADAVAGSGGGLVFIASSTASASATIDFNNNLSSTYDNYLVVIENVLPATNAVTTQMRVGTGAGPTYQTTSYSGNANCYAGSSVYASGTGALDISLTTRTSNTASRVGGGRVLVTGANSAVDKIVN